MVRHSPDVSKERLHHVVGLLGEGGFAFGGEDHVGVVASVTAGVAEYTG